MALTAGDVAIIGINSDNPDNFAFVALTAIPAGEEILFTDNGVLSDGSIRANEGVLRYTAPAGGVAVGEVVAFGTSPDFGTAGGSFSLSTSGDQVFAYQDDGTNITFLFAVQTNSTLFQTGSNDSNQSDLPPGLMLGETAVAVGAGTGAESEVDNAVYSGTTTGAKADILAAIADAANWTGSNTTLAMPSGPFTVTDGGGGTTPSIAINEIRIDSLVSGDDEFFELYGAPSQSLDGLTYLVIGDGTGGSGVIEAVVPLTGQSLNGDGFFYAAETTFTQGTPDLETVLNFENSDNVTHLLVQGFTGANGDDLDTDDDGVLDTLPWADVLDSLALFENISGEQIYSTEVVGPDGTFVPGHVFRETDGTGDWQIGTFNPVGETDTPGVTNVVVPTLAAPYSFDFETPFASAGWQAVSVDADAANTWFDDSFSGDNFAEVNGFGDSAAANDWLISPLINLDGLTAPVASFANVKNFDDAAVDDPEVSFLYSTDYAGSGDPTLATWVSLPYAFSTGGFAEVASGEIDLAGLTGDAYFAFQYTASGTSGGSTSLWQIDDFFVGEASNETAIPALIHEVQGSGATSPLEGTLVTLTAVVTADFQDSADSDYNGFFLQEEDADQDADAQTSEGIFVFEGGNLVDVAVGDLVEVTGRVSEFNGETQIRDVTSVVVTGTGSASAVDVAFPVASTTTNSDGHIIADLEAYEGMLISVPTEMTVSNLFTLGRYGDVGVNSGGRIQNFTQTNAPDVAAYADFQQDVAKRALILDDPFEDVQNGDPIFPLGGVDAATGQVLRAGDTITDVTGVVAFREPSFGDFNYRVVPTETPDFVSENPRPTEAPDVGGSLKVASFNVLNYFTSDDDNTAVTGPAGDQEARGAELGEGTDANGLTEFERQQAKTVAALDGLDADIVGLLEIENDPEGDTAIGDLVAALNAVSGRTYGFVDTGPVEGIQGGTVEGDAIKVGFIYDTATVSLDGGFAILDESVDPRFQTVDTQRPAVAQTFTEVATGESFTAAVNHFKSKGSIINGEAAIGDGQGNNNPTRTLAAEALVDWLDADPTASGDDDFMILGDLNAYLMEDPIQAILAGPDGIAGNEDDYSSLVTASDYSFGFPVNLGSLPHVQTYGTLDYALVNPSLYEQITGSAEWHINADEAVILDYNLDFQSADQQTAFFAADAFRASDHDPLLVGLNLGEGGAPVVAAVDPATVRELAKPGTIVADVEATDLQPLTYAITSGNTDNAFAIDASTGVITVASRGALADGAGPFELIVEVSDGITPVTTTVDVTLQDLPTLTSDLAVIVSHGDDDAIVAGGSNNLILPGNGADVVLAGDGNDSVLGGGGGDDLVGGLGNDLLVGNGADDCLDGGAGNDTVLGGWGNDEARGGADNDLIKGGRGDDTLFGGAGDDTLRGGPDADVFAFTTGFGDDTIRGFDAEADMLLFSDGIATTTSARGGVLVTVAGEGSVLVRGATLDEVNDLLASEIVVEVV